MTYEIRINKSAEKQLEKVPSLYYNSVKKSMLALANNPRPTGCKKLVGTKNSFRIRIGIYRVVYLIIDNILVVEIIDIKHRKDSYK